MEILLQRETVRKGATIGSLYIDGEFECYTLEDEPRNKKVKGKTCIPSGQYEIKKREVLSGMTSKYRSKYKWFDWHLEVLNIPDFEYVYVHIGNTPAHTDGCILVGSTKNVEEAFIGNSLYAYTALYKKISKELSEGIDVLINIRDIGVK